MKPWQNILIGFLLGLVICAVILLVISPQRGDSITLIPPANPITISVSISGCIKNPGVYELPVGSRVVDVVDLSGGLLPDADRDRINLAAKMKDEESIVIACYRPSSDNNQPSGNYGQDQVKYPININIASLEELMTLPGIGKTKAQEIIHYREENGYFETIEDILNVTGIGESIFAEIKDKIVTR